MANLTIQTTSTFQESKIRFFTAYLSIFIIAIGVFGNTLSFLVFRFHHAFKSMPSMIYLSIVAVSDTIALFEWNISHFIYLLFGFDVTTTNLALCRLLNFLQFTSLQVSALTLSIMCVDRYVTVMSLPGSFLSRLPLRTIKSALVWSLGIIVFCCLLNGHIIFTTGN